MRKPWPSLPALNQLPLNEASTVTAPASLRSGASCANTSSFGLASPPGRLVAPLAKAMVLPSQSSAASPAGPLGSTPACGATARRTMRLSTSYR